MHSTECLLMLRVNLKKWFHISALQPDVFGKHTEIGPSLNYNIRQKRKGGEKNGYNRTI